MSQSRFGRLCLLTIAALMTAQVPAFAETLSLVWDANTDPNVSGYIVYVGSSPNSYSQRLNVGNVTRYDVNATSGQTYCFAVSSFSRTAGEGDRSPEVCTNSNSRPTISNPGAQTSPVGQALTLALAAVDPEGAPLKFTATGLPAGLTLAANTGIISGTPTTAGTVNTAVMVSDGTLATSVSFSWTVTGGTPGVATLLRPTGLIATTTPQLEWAPVPTATRYRLWVDDASTNQQMMRDVTPAEAGCTTASSVCRALSGFTLLPGNASWSVRASNGFGDGPWSGSMDFTVPGAQRQALTVSFVTPTSSAAFSTGARTLAVSGLAKADVAVTQVSWANNRGGTGLAQGTSNWAVPSIALQTGTNVITVTARDSSGKTATSALTVTVATAADTVAPTVAITSPTLETTFSTNKATVTLAGKAADAGGIALVTWSTLQGASGTAAGTTAWKISAVPLIPGANVITVVATDKAGNTSRAQLRVRLSDQIAPVVTVISQGPATTKGAITVAGTASDNFGVVSVTWRNNRGGSGQATGTTAWKIASIPVLSGSNEITITVRDLAGNSGSSVLKVER